MTKNLKWRLGKLPTVEELLTLITNKLITQDEAKTMLFSSEDEDGRDKKSLESEIKFLRELVETLSKNQQSRIVEVVKEVYRPYRQWDWYRPYEIWCTSTGVNNGVYVGTGSTTIDTNLMFSGKAGQTNSVNALSVTGGNTANFSIGDKNQSFSDIKTF